MSGFIVRVYCDDCSEPGYGCNDGAPWYVCGDDDEPARFATREEAEAAGWKAVSGVGPWRFEIEDAPQ